MGGCKYLLIYSITDLSGCCPKHGPLLGVSEDRLGVCPAAYHHLE